MCMGVIRVDLNYTVCALGRMCYTSHSKTKLICDKHASGIAHALFTFTYFLEIIEICYFL